MLLIRPLMKIEGIVEHRWGTEEKQASPCLQPSPHQDREQLNSRELANYFSFQKRKRAQKSGIPSKTSNASEIL